ncbi:MAG TPA: hypothetical protein VHD34_10345 [Xanthobacteraceae bacterium]|nr:hypothetical protein [Xanthobacteraceae bacterium]
MHSVQHAQNKLQQTASTFLNCSKGKASFTPALSTAHNFKWHSLAEPQVRPADEPEHRLGLFLAAKIKRRKAALGENAENETCFDCS